MTTMSYVEANKKMSEMFRARDAFGNPLYSDTEIANVFGCENIDQLHAVLDKARTGYRNNLIKNITALKEKGMRDAEIAVKMHLDSETVKILTDSVINDCLKSRKAFEAEREQMLSKVEKNMKEWEEMRRMMDIGW